MLKKALHKLRHFQIPAGKRRTHASFFRVLRHSLIYKYSLVIAAAVSLPLVINEAVQTWFGFAEQRSQAEEILALEARSAASRITEFVEGLRGQLGWTVLLPWSNDPNEQRTTDGVRLLRQAPAVNSLLLLDAAGKERLFVSRTGLNRINTLADRSGEPGVVGARAQRVWYGPVRYLRGSEPFMTMSVAGPRFANGVAIAEINLKLIQDVISGIHVGKAGQALVIDTSDHLVAHPDISLVLRGEDRTVTDTLRQLRLSSIDVTGHSWGKDLAGHQVVAASAGIGGVDWTVIVTKQSSEAFAPLYSSLYRTAALLLIGLLGAICLAFLLARRLTYPISVLGRGVELIGAGMFDHRIEIATGDEFERLAARFNRMAGELKLSQERAERIDRLRRFLPLQVAELVDQAGSHELLEGRRQEVVVVFGDLRGFSAFTLRSKPDAVMDLLGDYYSAVGRVVTEWQATLIQFAGDGFMVLLNAPLTCQDPGLRAVRMSVDMQAAVQDLAKHWNANGHAIGFGIGIAAGPATVGQVGYQSRSEYTAIGTVVNTAARLCALAKDTEILVDADIAECTAPYGETISMGDKELKGIASAFPVYRIGFDRWHSTPKY